MNCVEYSKVTGCCLDGDMCYIYINEDYSRVVILAETHKYAEEIIDRIINSYYNFNGEIITLSSILNELEVDYEYYSELSMYRINKDSFNDHVLVKMKPDNEEYARYAIIIDGFKRYES